MTFAEALTQMKTNKAYVRRAKWKAGHNIAYNSIKDVITQNRPDVERPVAILKTEDYYATDWETTTADP